MSDSIIRVIVADDSLLMRLLIKSILEEDSGITVIGQAKDGKEAATLCCQLKPDVVLLDMLMGEYDGIYGVRSIMNQCPTPIIILSAIGNTDMSVILEALSLGAVDYLNKPAKNNTNMRDVGLSLIDKVKLSATIKPRAIESVLVNVNPHSFSDEIPYDVVVIGASTGGPTAIEQVILNLPENFAVPVIIAQHMPPNFVQSFATRLNGVTPLHVSMAIKDDVLEKGKILIVPGSRNSIVRREGHKVVIDFTQKRFSEYNFPSVSCLMKSVSEVYGPRCIGVILTGMGKDGTEGMVQIKKGGGYTIAQSESTSVVFGMPKSAIDSGCIDQIVPLDEIGSFVVGCIS